MNILFYYPSNYSALSLSSLMIAFRQQGHGVYLLTHTPPGDLHRDVQPAGVKTFAHVISRRPSWYFYLAHLVYLSGFCRKHRIHIVYAHLQQANIIAVLARFFMPAHVIACRHHSDYPFGGSSFFQRLFDHVINRLSKEIIVPSEKVYKRTVYEEGTNPNKVRLIRYAYDFSQFTKPDPAEVQRIRAAYPAKLLIVKAARLVVEKRHPVLFSVVEEMVRKGRDVKLLVLSEGYEKEKLERLIREHRLENRIFMLGFRRNVTDYLAAADVIVHVSSSEASNNLAKEASMLEKTVIVCRDVGDFDDYMTHMENCIRLDKENPAPGLAGALEEIYQGRIDLARLGKNLRQRVLELFSVEKVIRDYDEIHRQFPAALQQTSPQV